MAGYRTSSLFGCSWTETERVSIQAKWPTRPELIPGGFRHSMWRLTTSTPPRDGLLVHRRVTPSINVRRYLFIHLGGGKHCEKNDNIQPSWPNKLYHGSAERIVEIILLPSCFEKKKNVSVIYLSLLSILFEFLQQRQRQSLSLTKRIDNNLE